ncbi:MAG TPA: chaperone NapD [Nitrospiraceae bacterium]|nr:chaperone NapD [Nitrospiraceae bacterium]
MSSTAHVSSLIVRARPEQADAVAQSLTKIAGLEVHAVQDGKIIVVLEAPTHSGLAESIDAIRAEPGVLLVNLIYHEVETT